MRDSADTLGWIGVQTSDRNITNLRYVDDVMLIVTSPIELYPLVSKLNEKSQKFQLEISTKNEGGSWQLSSGGRTLSSSG